MTDDEWREMQQSDLEYRPYKFWDDMWNEDSGYNYEKHAESD